MKKSKKITLKQIMKANPNWNWKSLNGQGFYELMQLYRHSSIAEQTEVSKWFEIIKSYIRWYSKELKENQKPEKPLKSLTQKQLDKYKKAIKEIY